MALIVDGKSADTEPLRVTGDPEIVLTEAERRRMFDMAMEMHELQRPATDAATALGSLSRQLTELGNTTGTRNDIPAGPSKRRSRVRARR